jgi:hypothetical protein
MIIKPSEHSWENLATNLGPLLEDEPAGAGV